MLPPRSNLRHLKDQAKDLVKAGTATSIADAQFKIARRAARSTHAGAIAQTRD